MCCLLPIVYCCKVKKSHGQILKTNKTNKQNGCEY